jgi:hypothetical protein
VPRSFVFLSGLPSPRSISSVMGPGAICRLPVRGPASSPLPPRPRPLLPCPAMTSGLRGTATSSALPLYWAAQPRDPTVGVHRNYYRQVDDVRCMTAHRSS